MRVIENVRMLEAGEKSVMWTRYFLNTLTSVTGDKKYQETKIGYDDKIELKVRQPLATPGISFVLENKTTGEVLVDSYNMADFHKNVFKPILDIRMPVDETKTDPIFFYQKGNIVSMIRYRGLDIALVVSNFDSTPEITDLNGNPLDTWEDVINTYPNDEEFDKFLNSDYCDGVSLPNFSIAVYMNRFLSADIDHYMEINNHYLEEGEQGVRDFELMSYNDCLDFDKLFEHAITYKDFKNMITERPEIFETIDEVYSEFLVK